jgi:hypothetical protein
VSALWHVASTDGTIVFPMDSGGSKTSAAQLRQDFDAAARAWRAREEAQHELNYSKMDEMDRELHRLFSR